MAVTILNVEKLTRGKVRIRFTSRGGGCAAWQTIVDDTHQLIDAFSEALDRPAEFLDGEKSLGRGARVDLPLRLYLAVRIALEQHDAARSALKAQRFMIDDASAVGALVVKIARGHLPQEPGWMKEVGDLGITEP